MTQPPVFSWEKQGWWAAEESDRGDFPWVPHVQLRSVCLDLDISFKTEAECLEFIRTEILPLGLLDE